MVVSATGNLYNALYPDDRYDLIVANPPLLPIPSGVPYPFVGDGGSDGLSIVREIIKGGSLKLLPDGEILIIGMTILRNGQIIPPLSEYLMNAGLSGVITIIASYGTGMEDSWVKGVALTSMLHAPDACKNQKDLQRLLAKGYRKMGADKVCTYILRGWPDAHPTFTVQNISGESDEQDPWMLF
jgi:hypothetical protein